MAMDLAILKLGEVWRQTLGTLRTFKWSGLVEQLNILSRNLVINPKVS